MRITEKDDRKVVQAEGELDLSNAEELRAALQQAIGQSDGDVVIDLTNALYIDSAALQELIRAHNTQSGRDRKLIVVAKPTSQPGQVLRTVMFHTIMTIRGSWDELPD